MEVEVMLMNWSKNDTPSHLELCDPPGPLQNHLCPSRSATSYWKLWQGAPSNLSTLLLPLLAFAPIPVPLFLIFIANIRDRVVEINTFPARHSM